MDSPAPEHPEPQPARQPRLPLRGVIVGFCLAFGLLLTGPLVWFNYSRSSGTALEVAGTLFDQASASMSLRVRLLMQPFDFLGDHVSLMPRVGEAPAGFEHPLRPFFLDFLRDTPQLYSLYLAYGQGGFFQIIRVEGRPTVAADLGAPAGSHFAVRAIDPGSGERLERWQFLDRDFAQLAAAGSRPAKYDPRIRPWYLKALATDGPVRTDLYLFSSTRDLGFTISRRIPSAQAVVFGADMTIDSLSHFLRKERIGPSGALFLFDAEGGLIGHSGMDRPVVQGGEGAEARRASLETLDDPLARAVYDRFVAAGRGPLPRQLLDVGGQDSLIQVNRMDEFGSRGAFMGLAALAGDFTAPLAHTRNQSLFFALGLFLVAVSVLALAANRLALGLRQLAQEADRIRGLDLGGGEFPPSHIREMEQLNRSVANMRGALQALSRYLPQTLVKQFVVSGLAPEPGGERREITLLFTDVENFTPLAEHLAPEDLMQDMSDYFEVVGQAILECGGTIDKFIGDAVMAFWNAPFASEDHVEQACAAALRLSKASEVLNRQREESGLPALHTRVGIHTGTAVVGNLGSPERMDYTALGANVNLASRLEGLNKFYATRILVSRVVRERAKHHFLFRSVDVVVPKGASEPLMIFELVGGMPQGPHADVAAPRARLGFCSRWERAITLYRTGRWDLAHREFTALGEAAPEDHLARVYQTRAQRLMENKEGRDWKAIKRYKVK